MLGKLIALDFRSYKAQFKVAFPIYSLLILSTLLLRGLNIPYLGSISFGFSVVATIGLLPVALLLGLIHYYRHFYSQQGYLTHTLPVKPSERLHSKLISAFILYFAATVVAVVSALLLVLANGISEGIGFASVSVFLRTVGAWPAMVGLTGFVGWLLAIALWLFIFLICFSVYSFCISVGMGRKLARFGFAGPIIVYVVYYIISQVGGLASFAFIPLSLRTSMMGGLPKFGFVTEIPLTNLSGLSSLDQAMDVEQALQTVGGHFDFGLGIVIFTLAIMVICYMLTRRELGKVNLR